MAGPKRGLPEKRRMRHDRHYVDELTRRMGEGIGRMIRLDSIVSNSDQPRNHLGDLKDLMTSISRHGILEPLLVRKIDHGGYQLISGERRFAAAAELGLDEAPCIELFVADDVALEIALIENLQRQDLNAFEEAEGFRTLIDKYNYTQEQVSTAVGRSRVTVNEGLRLLVMPEEIRTACRHADIHAKGVLLEIAKAPNIDAMHALIQAVIEDDVDRQALRALRHALGEDGNTGNAESPLEVPNGEVPKKRKAPFVWRYEAKDQPFKLSLSFRTESEPERQDVIDALESLLSELKQGRE